MSSNLKIKYNPSYPVAHPNLGLILGTRRGGTSVFAHVLATIEGANYMGELHEKWEHNKPNCAGRLIDKVSDLAGRSGYPFNPQKMTYDKVVDGPGRAVTKMGLGFGIASKIWIVLRHPVCAVASAIRSEWSGSDLNYFLEQFLMIRSTIELWKGHREMCFVDYYDLFSPEGRAKHFGEEGRLLTKYLVNPLSGRHNYGDPSKTLSDGTLLDRNFKEDYEKNLPIVKDAMGHPYWKHIMQIYENIKLEKS